MMIELGFYPDVGVYQQYVEVLIGFDLDLNSYDRVIKHRAKVCVIMEFVSSLSNSNRVKLVSFLECLFWNDVLFTFLKWYLQGFF